MLRYLHTFMWDTHSVQHLLQPVACHPFVGDTKDVDYLAQPIAPLYAIAADHK
jgi:hypothetical protein